jgi:5'-3' exonuclease
MGIKNLHKFLKKHVHPESKLYRECHLSDWKNKRIAIDTNIYLYKFKGINKDNWIMSFALFMLKFRKHHIDCICIYDTKAPVEKNARKEERKQRKKNIEHRKNTIEDAIHEYKETGVISSVLHEITAKMAQPQHHRLLFPSDEKKETEEVGTSISEEAVYKEINSLEYQMVNISREDIQLSKELLTLMGIAFIDSENEAETLCSHLCVNQQVHAVLSDDTDVLVYGTPCFLTKFNMKTETCVEMNIDIILTDLQFSQEQFVDLCILSGTDYNDNVPNIGSEKAFKLLQKYGSIEAIQENKPEIDWEGILNYVRVRELFRVPSRVVKVHQTCTIPPSKEELTLFLARHGIRMFIEDLFTV